MRLILLLIRFQERWDHTSSKVTDGSSETSPWAARGNDIYYLTGKSSKSLRCREYRLMLLFIIWRRSNERCSYRLKNRADNYRWCSRSNSSYKRTRALPQSHHQSNATPRLQSHHLVMRRKEMTKLNLLQHQGNGAEKIKKHVKFDLVS